MNEMNLKIEKKSLSSPFVTQFGFIKFSCLFDGWMNEKKMVAAYPINQLRVMRPIL